mgnify:CR=1 FL=1
MWHVKETVNKDTQTSGGAKGFILKPNAVSKFYLAAEYIDRASSEHNDLQLPSRIARDESDVKSIVSLLQTTWLNPFNSNLQDLVCLSTGKVATPEVEHDLLQAQDLGEKAYKEFCKQRLQTDPSEIKFHKIKKAKLKTFTNLNKRVKVRTGKNKKVILKAHRKLFAQMIVIAESRKLRMTDPSDHFHGR